VVRICQLVDGLPLALAMAAAWTKTLRCSDIADEIQRDIAFLNCMHIWRIRPTNSGLLRVMIG